MATEENKHIWKFYRYGGIDQVELETADDLLKLDELDPKLWCAMTCPVSNMDYDQQTLTYLDTDGDKRIKIPEVIAAAHSGMNVLGISCITDEAGSGKQITHEEVIKAASEAEKKFIKLVMEIINEM